MLHIYVYNNDTDEMIDHYGVITNNIPLALQKAENAITEYEYIMYSIDETEEE